MFSDAPRSLEALVKSWARSLRAVRRAPKTIKNYVDAAHQLIAYLAATGMPTAAASITREHVESYLDDLHQRDDQVEGRDIPGV